MSDSAEKYPDYDFILPLPGPILEEMAERLGLSKQTLYKIVKRNHKPSKATLHNLSMATGLDLEKLYATMEAKDVVSMMYDWFRGKLVTSADSGYNDQDMSDLTGAPATQVQETDTGHEQGNNTSGAEGSEPSGEDAFAGLL